MLCAVIDTNVLVSAALAKQPDASIPSRVVECAFEGAYTPLFSAAIVAEYSEVLSRPKFKIDERKRRLLLDEFIACGVFVDAPPTGVTLPDPKDVMFHGAPSHSASRAHHRCGVVRELNAEVFWVNTIEEERWNP